MDAQGNFRMLPGVSRHFRQPRRRLHDGSGSDGMLVERSETGLVGGVVDANVVGQNDQELGIGRISELLRDALYLGIANNREEKEERQQGASPRMDFRKTTRHKPSI